MKKLICVLLALIMTIVFVGCSAADEKPAAPQPEEIVETPEPTPSTVTETDYMTVEGIYVDESYVDEDNSALKMVYLIYTVHTDAENLSVSSTGLEMTVGDVNTYSFEHYGTDVGKYMRNLYYSSYLEDVMVGGTLRMMATAKVPEGDLTGSKTLTFADSFNNIPQAENIKMNTDDIIFMANTYELAKTVDPEGYAEEMSMREDADEETAAKVSNMINGYYWEFYISPTSYHLEFFKPNEFTMTTSLGSNSGTYTVKKGYIFCEYPSNGYIVEIPYTIGDSGIELDVVEAFDVRG